jgi:hypothetical protein
MYEDFRSVAAVCGAGASDPGSWPQPLSNGALQVCRAVIGLAQIGTRVTGTVIPRVKTGIPVK